MMRSLVLSTAALATVLASQASVLAGVVYSWGYNANGQLGDGTTTTRLRPVPVSGMSNVAAIAAGGTHSLALKSDGTVWAWGDNTLGNLADGTTTQRTLPVQVVGLSGVSAIAAGYQFSNVLLPDGTLKAWGGDNSYGQIGDGSTSTRSSPVAVTGLSNVAAISDGAYHAFALLNDGTVRAWGANGGRLGDGTTATRLSPVILPALSNVKMISGGGTNSLAVLNDGTVKSWGTNFYGQIGDGTTTDRTSPVTVPGLANVRSVSCGNSFSLALLNDGTVRAWGANPEGRLGDGTTTNRSTPVVVSGLTNIVKVLATETTSYAMSADGRLWAWGYNLNGQLALGDTTSRSTPTEVVSPLPGYRFASISGPSGGAHMLAMLEPIPVTTSATMVYGWGYNGSGMLGDGTNVNRTTPVPSSGLTSAASVAALGDNSLALMSDGTVRAWGRGDLGQLGDGASTGRTSPITVGGLAGVRAINGGAQHSMVLLNDGTVRAFGYNSNGQIGDGTNTNRSTPVTVSGLSSVTSIAGGAFHSIALRSDGTVRVWGYNAQGQLGDGTATERTTPIVVAGLSGITAIGAGAYHSIAVMPDGTVKTWGYNASGQLGDGTTTNRSTPVTVGGLSGVVAVTGGTGFSLALLADGTLRAWGTNANGQIGDGTTTQRNLPVPVLGLTRVASIAATSFSSYAVTADGRLFSWGYPGFGELGHGDLANRFIPTEVRCPVAGYRFKSISGHNSGEHVLAVIEPIPARTVYAFGYNLYGQLGDGTTISRSSPVRVLGLSGAATIGSAAYSSLAVRPDGSLVGWGSNQYANLGDGTFADRSTPVVADGLGAASAITGGNGYTLALLTDGTVRGLGYNFNGELGDTTYATYRSGPVSVSGLSGVTAISCGTSHNLALRSDGTAWAWGRGVEGQLGTGTFGLVAAFPLQIGNLGNMISISAGAKHSLGVDMAGVVVAWGYNNRGQLGDGTISQRSSAAVVSGLSGVAGVSAGSDHSLAVLANGTVRAWGGNSFGKLGDGTTTDRLTPVVVTGLTNIVKVQATLGSSYAISKDGRLWAWGDNAYGQLGLGDNANRLTPTEVPSPLPGYRFASIAGNAGASHLIVGLEPIPKTLYAWGRNDFGQIGDGTTTDRSSPVAVPGMTSVTGVSAGESHSLALLDDGTVRAWGQGGYGAVADGAGSDRLSPFVVPGLSGVSAVAGGWRHSWALKSDGTARAWGWNNVGQLGDDTQIDAFSPVAVFGLGSTRAIAAGGLHSLALLNDGTVKVTGSNASGQLAVGFVGGSFPPRAQPVSGLGGVSSIAAGYGHSLAAISDGTVKAWGENGWGQVGNGTTTTQSSVVSVGGLTGVVSVAAGFGHSLAARTDGTVLAWGDNTYGQLGSVGAGFSATPVPVPGLSNIVKVEAGSRASYALSADGRLWAWGRNTSGQLGLGDSTTRNTPTEVSPPVPGYRFKAIASDANGDHVLATLELTPSVGGCCLLNGSCVLTSGLTACSGTFQGVGSLCAVITCPPAQGSCCASTGVCTTTTQPACSTTWTIGVACAPNPCPQPQVGVCCQSDGSCSIATSGIPDASCMTGTLVVNGTCSPNSCPQPQVGVCCQSDGTCTVATSGIPSATCTTGSLVVNGTCSPNSCPQPVGACCAGNTASSTCTVGPSMACAAGGFLGADTTCSPGICAPPQIVISQFYSGGGATTGSPTYKQDYIELFNRSSAPIDVSGWTIQYASATGVTWSACSPIPISTTIPAGKYFLIKFTQGGSPIGDDLTGEDFAPIVRIAAAATTGKVAIVRSATHLTGTCPLGVAVVVDFLGYGTQANCSETVNGPAPSDTAHALVRDWSGCQETSNNAADFLNVVPAPRNSATAAHVCGGNVQFGACCQGNGACAIATAGIPSASCVTGTLVVNATCTPDPCPAAGRVAYGWGSDLYGQVGDGTTGTIRSSPTPIGSIANVVSIQAGGLHSLARLSDGTVKAWGYNGYGEVGDGSLINQATPVPVSALTDGNGLPVTTSTVLIAGGFAHSLAVYADGSAAAWGNNSSGQLGDGSTTTSAGPIAVSGLSGVFSVAGGGDHSLAVRGDGTVRAWGLNSTGQLGNGSTTNSSALLAIANLGGVTSVAAGFNFSLALRSDGTVRAWGSNVSGQLGDGTTTQRISPVTVAGLSGVVSIAAGAQHSLAALSNGTVWAWGDNTSKQLGDGTNTNHSTPLAVPGLASIVAVAASSQSSFALSADGRLWAWGSNQFGELGLGDTTERAAPTEVPSPRPGTVFASISAHADGIHVVALVQTSGPIGACCAVSGCALNYAGSCVGAFLGDRTTCAAVICPPTQVGVCCKADGSCTPTAFVGVSNCEGQFYPNTACTLNPCPQPQGSCCAPSGVCTTTTQAACSATWTIDGVCDPNPCPPPQGSCCALTGLCSTTTQAACTANWTVYGVCSPNPCPPPQGSCCAIGGICTTTTQAACSASWSNGGICNAATCPIPGVSVDGNINGTVNGNRPTPSPTAPPATYAMNNLTIGSGGSFGLGANETLILGDGSGTLTVGAGGVLYANGTIVGNIVNNGLVIIPITRVGLLCQISGGSVQIDPGSATGIVQVPNLPCIGGSVVTIGRGSGSSVRISGPVQSSGTVRWDGQLDVTGSFTQTAAASLRLFIAGTTQGVRYSLLNVGTTAALDGKAEIVLQPELFAYIPHVGDSFDMVVATQGITLPSGSLTIKSLMTAAGASALGLSLPAYDSGYASDPNQLVTMPNDLFTYSIVNGGTTLRITMIAPVCAPSVMSSSSLVCPNGSATFSAGGVGSGPFTYQWQIQLPSGVWTDLSTTPVSLACTGAGGGSALASATAPAAASTMIHIQPCPAAPGQSVGIQRYSVRTVVSSGCGAIPGPTRLISVCTADFDCSGGLAIADIFTFLNAWFAGSPSANFDGVNSLQVADIFAFLNAWFAGCA